MGRGRIQSLLGSGCGEERWTPFPWGSGADRDQPPDCPLYLLHSVSRLRGWQGGGGGLEVGGGPARAAVDGLGQDGMEHGMEHGLVMCRQTRSTDGGGVGPRGPGQGLHQSQHRGKLLGSEYISRNLVMD